MIHSSNEIGFSPAVVQSSVRVVLVVGHGRPEWPVRAADASATKSAELRAPSCGPSALVADEQEMDVDACGASVRNLDDLREVFVVLRLAPSSHRLVQFLAEHRGLKWIEDRVAIGVDEPQAGGRRIVERRANTGNRALVEHLLKHFATRSSQFDGEERHQRRLPAPSPLRKRDPRCRTTRPIGRSGAPDGQQVPELIGIRTV